MNPNNLHDAFLGEINRILSAATVPGPHIHFDHWTVGFGVKTCTAPMSSSRPRRALRKASQQPVSEAKKAQIQGLFSGVIFSLAEVDILACLLDIGATDYCRSQLLLWITGQAVDPPCSFRPSAKICLHMPVL